MDRRDAPGVTVRTPIALAVAGSDSGAGAGIQADLRTFAALGVHAATAITALTAQNTRGVRAIHLAPPDVVAAQIEAVMEDFEIAAVKIGMLGSAAIVEAVAERLRFPSPQPSPASARGGESHLPLSGEGGAKRRMRAFVVYDPVMAASSGEALSGAGFLEAVRATLLPLVDCLTPNLAEAAALLGEGIARSEADMARQGRALIALGPRAVLMKGGHLRGRRGRRPPRDRGRRPPLRRAEARLEEPARHRLHAVERDCGPCRPRQAAAGGRRRRQGLRARGDRGGARPQARRRIRAAGPVEAQTLIFRAARLR